MSLAQGLLLAAILVSLVVLAFRPLDAPRSFLLGLIAYFSPGLMPEINFFYGVAPTDDRTVLICAAVMGASALIASLIPPAPASTQRLLRINQSDQGFTNFIAWSALLFLLFLMARHGPLFFAVARAETPLGGYEQVVFRIVATLALIMGALNRSYFAIGIASVMLLIYTIMGDRTAVAMAVVAWMAHLSYARGYTGAQLALKLWPVFIAGALFVAFGKQAYVTANLLVRGELDAAVAVTQSNVAAGLPEPVLVFQHLNQTVVQDWKLDVTTLQGGLIGQIPFSAAFGFRSDTFNRLMQNELYPSALPFSLAFNPWAEGWAIGGWFGVFVVWSVLIAALLGMHRIAARRSGALHAVTMILVAYLGVYSQRNTVFNAASTLVQLSVATAGLFAAYWAWSKAASACRVLSSGQEDLPEPDDAERS